MRIASTARVDRWVVAGLVATAIFAGRQKPSTGERTTAHHQVAVLSNGFAVLDGFTFERHVTGLSWDGEKTLRYEVPEIMLREARVFGVGGDIGIGYHEGTKLVLATVTGDGELGESTEWGKNVKHLCDGVATNEHRFGVAWLEASGRVGVVLGSPRRALGVATMPRDTAATRTVWCGVTSAGDKIAVLRRDQHDRTRMGLCGDRGCANKAVVLPLAKGDELVSIACNEARCAAVSRDYDGNARLSCFGATTGKLVWSQPLVEPATFTEIALTAAGPNAFVMAYLTYDGAIAERVIESGSRVRVWADPYRYEVPAIAWANDRLVLAHRFYNDDPYEIVPLPR